ncbi:MAG: D-amino acid dehydrogenase [Alphaproteobacteria bacterium]|nr:D-amino acid dehydrogenase [Alphaproteobacteria bacterium]
MKVVIIGAGIIGVSSAYALAKRGHDVIVIERRGAPGLETTYANGALLTPSMADPWNAPGCWKVLLGSLCREDSPLQLRLKALPSLTRWGPSFLKSANPVAFKRNRVKNLRLAQYSLNILGQWRAVTGISYCRSERGTLKLFRNHKAHEEALEVAAALADEGIQSRRLTLPELLAFEPALAPISKGIAGAILYPEDETGDAYQFCVALAERAKAEGAAFLFNQTVGPLRVEHGQLVCLDLVDQRLRADRYVIAAGSYISPLLQLSGLNLPVTPVKGYSLTVFDGLSHCALRAPLVDDSLHVVVVPLGSDLRVAGTAEFAGFDLSLRKARLSNLATQLSQILPILPMSTARIRPWCGLRPMSTDGVPIVSATPIANLYVNCGHGHLGWTTAAGSAELLADLLDEKAPTVDASAYSLARFGQKTTRAKYPRRNGDGVL